MTSTTFDPELRARLERAADRDRPPAPWLYLAHGLLLGLALATWPLGPVIFAGAVAAVIAVILVVEHRLHHRHGVPRGDHLPAEVRRPFVVWMILLVVVVSVPVSLAPTTGSEAPALVAAVLGAVVAGVGGPLADRSMRRAAARALDG